MLYPADVFVYPLHPPGHDRVAYIPVAAGIDGIPGYGRRIVENRDVVKRESPLGVHTAAATVGQVTADGAVGHFQRPRETDAAARCRRLKCYYH